ncbi:MAG: bifunctional [glutamine synthetase] adenylyltransferase/[glutamine synthetase]-adenylyl-L-tyrosine phosphorylase [Actinobacteria bacterium]|nr:bifunctional [glutamine synthetase] adenylyltransferase/[glutamine synthetase]-adenylyl-L-tyrosine phosphorylase [Actinomycetota bacterium]
MKPVVEPSELASLRVAALARGSRSLSEFLERDEAAAALLERDDPLPDDAGYRALISAAAGAGTAGVRLERRRRLLEIAARDLAGELDVAEVGRALADLASASLQAVLDATGAADSLAVIGMGKLGGRELNYASDIDVVFVSDGDVGAATKSAEVLLRELGAMSPEGQAYRIDLNLRPEGRSGALVRSLDATIEYYRRWAQTWEFQALIKARPVAGASNVGAAFFEQTRPFVFVEEMSADDVTEIRKMKERVETHAQRSARRRAADDDVKLGSGGIRDIEFSIQLLQLVHGGADPAVRSGNTLEALAALVDGGYVADDDGAGLAVAYRWLRNVEHRLQLWQERQVHHLPSDPEARTRIAYTMGFKDSPSASALTRFEERHDAVLRDVRGRFERLFYRPMIESLSDGTAGGLSEEALKERLMVLGFRDVDRSARTLHGLVSGTSRLTKLFRVLSPALLRHLASTPLPDEGLFGFLTLGEKVESRLDTLAAFRDNPPGLEFLARVLGSGRLLSDVLAHVPEELTTIADPRGPGPMKDRDRLVREAIASLGWRDRDRRLDGLRRFKRKEMLRVTLGDLSGEADVEAVGAALSDLADACLVAALEQEGAIPFTVVGMGKLGGRELNYSSDIDVMFVHDMDPAEAERVAERLMKAIGEVTPEGQAFRIDAGLRPEGKSGPLARSLQSFAEYYERWSSPWEHQALVKARVTAGDERIGAVFVEMTAPLAFPKELTPAAVGEIRHLKVRMEKERIPRGVDPRRHLKLGPGGASDIEFSTQLLQLRHGHSHPELQVANTLDALRAATVAGVIGERDASHLADAYRFVARARNRLFFLAGRPVDVLPTKPEDLEALGIALGFTEQPRQEVEESYLRVTRRARRVAETVLYG